MFGSKLDFREQDFRRIGIRNVCSRYSSSNEGGKPFDGGPNPPRIDLPQDFSQLVVGRLGPGAAARTTPGDQ